MRTRTSTAEASPSQRHLHERSTEQWGSLAAGRPESQVSGSLGGGGETDWAEQPFPQTPGLLSQAAAVPSPSALADNGRFTAGCRC